jgi:hypothetical protein
MSAPFALDCLDRRPYRDLHPCLLRALEQLTSWPSPEQYNDLARQVPQPAEVALPRFVTENRDAVRRHGGYEHHVARLRAVPTRPANWHDFFNMTVWAHFPKLRWALNSLHVDPGPSAKDPRNGRTPGQNLAATFDESGMLVVSTDPSILEDLRALHFKRAFWDRRADLLSSTRFYLVGHGSLESLLTPHAALSARSLQLHLPTVALDDDQLRFDIDAFAATQILAWRATRTILDPIPLLAIPDYCANDSAAFYDDPSNIRFDPISRRPSANVF